MENFTLLYTLGEGYVVYSTYGKVVKAINKTTGTPVAIKKFKNMDNNTEIKKIALREIKILKRLSHPNIVNLLDVILINNRISIVFEFVESTVFEILKSNPMGIDQKKAKKLIYQLLLGLDHCHRMGIVHRDIKPENLLVSEAGTLKICDFGFARQYKSKETMTQYVSTRWYRAPELLLMAEYGLAVDVWAVGCVLAELLTGKPLFPGKNDYDTLNMIVKMCGNIPSGLAKSFKSSKKFLKLDLPRNNTRLIDDLFKHFPPKTLEFLLLCFELNTEKRSTIQELLNHPYFEYNIRQEVNTKVNFTSILTPRYSISPTISPIDLSNKSISKKKSPRAVGKYNKAEPDIKVLDGKSIILFNTPTYKLPYIRSKKSDIKEVNSNRLGAKSTVKRYINPHNQDITRNASFIQKNTLESYDNNKFVYPMLSQRTKGNGIKGIIKEKVSNLQFKQSYSNKHGYLDLSQVKNNSISPEVQFNTPRS